MNCLPISEFVQGRKVLPSASHPLANISRPVHLNHSLLLASALPKIVTAITEPNINNIPVDC